MFLSDYFNFLNEEYDDYFVKYCHNNIRINDIIELKSEYENIYNDLLILKDMTGEEYFKIYFNDIHYLEKMVKCTDILDNKDFIYVYCKDMDTINKVNEIDKDIKCIVDIDNINDIEGDNNIVLRINGMNELNLDRLNELNNNYNISGILIDEYVTGNSDNKEFYDDVCKYYKCDNYYDAEKYLCINNDLYDVDTYKDIYNELSNIIENNTNSCSDVFDNYYNLVKYISNRFSYNNDGFDSNELSNQTLLSINSNTCVCEGYSKVMRELCNLMGIDNIIVGSGERKEVDGHLWNQVFIDGTWYNSDCTLVSTDKDDRFVLFSDNIDHTKSNSLIKHECGFDYNFDKGTILI